MHAKLTISIDECLRLLLVLCLGILITTLVMNNCTKTRIVCPNTLVSLEEGQVRCEGFNRGLEEMQHVQGAYWQDSQVACIWLQDRTEQDINRTLYHEKCHWLVNQSYNHFCKEIE